jgi:hypothetical protein
MGKVLPLLAFSLLISRGASSKALHEEVTTASNSTSTDAGASSMPGHSPAVLAEADPQLSPPQQASFIKAFVPIVTVETPASKPSTSTSAPISGGPDALTFVTGFETNAAFGMSYKNPSVGGFAHARWTSRGRLGAWSTTELSNDQKTYNKDGRYITNTSEVGVRVTKMFTPTAVSYFGRQSNSSYSKAMASVGFGVRAVMDHRTSFYAQYLFPDFLSFNHTRRLVWGFDSYFPYGRKVLGYFGIGQSFVLFDQPRNGHVDLLIGMTISLKTGIVFGTSRANNN